ncbi:3-hydroxyacyl-ACP dehydratase [uncultured Kriegella sp.]|uniref:3-hydroxyacyl-ACP dehydratase n=1 Tax=uncultured Kriegella sp. TaxID=1798910 RepID=UPI0030D90167|tara:strand:+ start:88519 stop:88887 length:369 start_codon:yes stop_codon:yes gene_type:complete
MLIKDLYTVQTFEQSDESVTATVKLHKEHDIFKGHFPGNPVMPGVCMIQIIKELTEKAVDRELFLSTSSNIKFMAIINPEKNDILVLKLDITTDDKQIKVKNTSFFEDTLALKLNATFKILN